jgi:hypothetical protein
MHGIDWDSNNRHMSDQKVYWANIRTISVNALTQYFGSVNSGSVGWCDGTTYYDPSVDGKCNPVMAKQGWLPWMNVDHTPKNTCP